MNDPINLLVTAVGSELAFGVIKAARLASFPVRLHGCDIYGDVVGKHWCDVFRTLPPAARPNEYLSALREMVRAFKVTAIIPTADAEFELLASSRDSFLCDFGCHVLINPLEEILRFNDKWFAHQWYLTQGIPVPNTYCAETQREVDRAIEALGFPMVLKPRSGGGSRHICRVNSRDELRIHLPVVPAPILQEYISPDDEEYTAGTYRAADGQIHVIVMKRTLKFGMTNQARSLADRPELAEFCRGVISRTNLVGSNNIQFRIGKHGMRVLEINARFSGTTGIRAKCGFNDVEMWLTDLLGLGKIPIPRIRECLILRYMDEIYVDI